VSDRAIGDGECGDVPAGYGGPGRYDSAFGGVFELVDVRDVANIHILAMTSPAAGGQRFLATGDLLWLPDIARLLRSELGGDAKRVPTRSLPDILVRLMGRHRPEMEGVLASLERRNRHSTAKAEQLLGWRRRPGTEAVLDCARSLIEHQTA
jgi:nucleoside-diphosphate-sugar epimerase